MSVCVFMSNIYIYIHILVYNFYIYIHMDIYIYTDRCTYVCDEFIVVDGIRCRGFSIGVIWGLC